MTCENDITKNIPEHEVPVQIPLTPEDFYHALVTEAPLKPGDHGISPTQLDVTKCAWFQPELIQEGKDFAKRNFYSIILSQIIALLWTFTFKTEIAVLLRTGKSHANNSRDRYLSTILHIKLWSESDFLDKAAKGSQDIYGVRKQHSAAARLFSENKACNQVIPELPKKLKALVQAVQDELKNVDNSCTSDDELLHGGMPKNPLSQYAMTVTQFCFIGFLVIMPKSFGIRDTRGIDGYVHNWAIFGKLLGMEDRYNLAIHFLTTKKECRTKAFETIFEKIFLPNLKNVDDIAMYLWNGAVEGIREYMPVLRLKALVYFMIVYAADLTNPQMLGELMSWKDKLSFKYIEFCTHFLAKFRLGRWFVNNLMRFSIYVAQRIYLPKWKPGLKTYG